MCTDSVWTSKRSLYHSLQHLASRFSARATPPVDMMRILVGSLVTTLSLVCGPAGTICTRHSTNQGPCRASPCASVPRLSPPQHLAPLPLSAQWSQLSPRPACRSEPVSRSQNTRPWCHGAMMCHGSWKTPRDPRDSQWFTATVNVGILLGWWCWMVKHAMKYVLKYVLECRPRKCKGPGQVPAQGKL